MIARTLLIACAIALAGCATPRPPIEIPKVVQIPVPVPCIKAPMERPAFRTDGELVAMDDYRLVLELAADRLKRQGYEAVLEAQIAACR